MNSNEHRILTNKILKENREWFRDATRQLVSTKRIIKIKRIFNLDVEIKRLKDIK